MELHMENRWHVQLQMIRYMHIVWERLPAQKEVH